MRKELEAENRALRDGIDRLEREIARSHGPIGLSWLTSYIEQTRQAADKAREAAGAECRPASPDERRQRVADAFTKRGEEEPCP